MDGYARSAVDQTLSSTNMMTLDREVWNKELFETGDIGYVLPLLGF